MAAVLQCESPPLSRELIALQFRSTRTLSALDQACCALRTLERELTEFLDIYYAEIGPSIAVLQALEGQASVSAMPSPDPLPGLDAQVKSLYRRLARQCHPDSGGEPTGEAIRALNDAYAARDIGGLWKLQWEIERRDADPAIRVARLKAHCEQMNQALTSVEQRRQALLQSPGYALMQRAVLMRQCGQDFIAVVKAHLAQRIAQAQRGAAVSAP